jgi:hypothetical protein
VLLILFALKCVKRCCCGRSKPKVIPNPPIATAIPSNTTGQRVPSWSSLQNNGNEVGSDNRRDSAQPFMFNSVPPQRSYSPVFNGNGRRSDGTAPALYQNPFGPTERAARVPAALRPGGSSPTPQPPEPPCEPPCPLPPAAPRQSTWINANMAGVGSSGRRSGSGSGPGLGPRQNRSNWVDDRTYNGPRP